MCAEWKAEWAAQEEAPIVPNPHLTPMPNLAHLRT